jgi:hypothetical protein
MKTKMLCKCILDLNGEYAHDQLINDFSIVMDLNSRVYFSKANNHDATKKCDTHGGT